MLVFGLQLIRLNVIKLLLFSYLLISQTFLHVEAGQGRGYNDKLLESSRTPTALLLNSQIPMLVSCLFPSHKHPTWF